MSIERLIDKATELHEKNMEELDGLPDPVDYPSGFHYPSWYQMLRKMMSQRSSLGFARGVFYTVSVFSLAEKKACYRTFNHGEGI